MKTLIFAISFAILLVGAFLAGSWSGKHAAPAGNASGERKILYYIDPMNPTHTSDKPGLAPCGMKLEPVYADESAAGGKGAASSAPMAPGTVRIGAEKQQLIGIKTGQVEEVSETHDIRTSGKVAPDETRVYRLNSSTEGWIVDTNPVTTGSIVMKDQILATFYSRDFLAAEQAYFYALSTMDRFTKEGVDTPEQFQFTKAQVQSSIENLQNLGMADTQIQELARSRTLTENIQIRAPEMTFILFRDVSPGQRFGRGTELYRLADLRHVWVIADLFENEVHAVHPGLAVEVSLPHQGKTFKATVSEVLPQFDPASRTLKVRLELDNPDYFLRPDMFVDVRFPITLPPALTVPLEAVLDTGVRKIVFIDHENGFFEPREVETGWTFDNRMEIVEGLAAGERIVVSGTFLVDSESRMKLAASGMAAATAKDPVCKMEVDRNAARKEGLTSQSGGKIFYFCSEECKKEFEEKAQGGKRSAGASQAGMGMSGHGMGEAGAKAGLTEMLGYKDIVCGMPLDPAKAKAEGRQSEYNGRTYSFCSMECKEKFDNHPEQYVTEPAVIPSSPDQPMPDSSSDGGHQHD